MSYTEYIPKDDDSKFKVNTKPRKPQKPLPQSRDEAIEYIIRINKIYPGINYSKKYLKNIWGDAWMIGHLWNKATVYEDYINDNPDALLPFKMPDPEPLPGEATPTKKASGRSEE